MKSFRKDVALADNFAIGVQAVEDERCEITLTDYYYLDDSLSALLTLEEVKELREVIDQYIEVASALKLN